MTDEHMRAWANDFSDNRVGPLFHAIIDAVIDAQTPEEIRRIESRMRYMSNSIASYKNLKFPTREDYSAVG